MPHYRDLAKKKRTDEAYKVRRRVVKLRLKYGITPEHWDAMLIAQCGRCSICNDPMRVPCVDHDHETGKVRALLCSLCNTTLGHAGDSPERLRKMAQYLEYHKSS